jgi:prepilin peptidase CpaA
MLEGQYWITVLVVMAPIVAVACYIDWRYHKVPNWTTFPLAITGLIAQTYFFGLWTRGEVIAQGLGPGLIGLVVGLVLLLPVYAIGGMGAGDVKMLAGTGAWLGWELVLASFIVGAVVGGIYSVGVWLIWAVFVPGGADKLKANLSMLAAKFSSGKLLFSEVGSTNTLAGGSGQPPKLPYGVPLTVGIYFVCLLRSQVLEILYRFV